MTNFAILADSCSDLTAPLRERFGVDGYVPGALVYPDGSNHYADLDWKNMTPAQFFGTMKDKKGGLFTSAQIGLQDVADRFEPLLQQGRDILFVAVSSGLSGTYNSTCLVANELMEKYPERHIRCVDTLRYCGAEGMLVIAATRLRAAGKTLDETADWLEENRLRVHQMGVLEDLFFCKRMGRVSGAAAVMGTLVGIRPLADINEKGLSDVIGKTRGLAPALKATIDYMARTVERPEEQIMLLSHSDRPERAEELRALVEERFHPKELHVVPVCQSCGASIGPGLYAIFYFGRPISSGLTEESATEAEELLALPRDLGSGLTLQAVLPFSGPNVDADGAESDQLATIIVQNNGGMAVGAADITLTCEDGAELRFRVTDLPVGGSCYAFELNSAQYTGENRVCAASAEVEPDGSLSVDYRVSVMVQDGGLVLVNMTEDTLHNVTVRYRTDTGGTYFGGLSYTATVEELAPGASQTVLAAECYMGLPSVIAVSADES